MLERGIDLLAKAHQIVVIHQYREIVTAIRVSRNTVQAIDAPLNPVCHAALLSVPLGGGVDSNV